MEPTAPDQPVPPQTPTQMQEEQEHLKEYYTPEYWAKEIAAAKKWMQRWHARAKTIEKKYRLQDNEHENTGRFPLFWSNVQTALATAYGQIPKVEVDRANLDPKDDAARVAALILERIFNFEADDLENSPYYVFKDAILDRLVPGLGVAWARYEFDSEQRQLAPGLNDPATGQPLMVEVITEERTPLDYVRWDDFLFSPCKRWQEKRWTARRVPMTQRDLAKRFGARAQGVPMQLKGSATTRGSRDDDPLRALTEDMADVWEIWCGTTKTVHWWVQGATELLDNKQDPLKLQSFYPCRRPLIANVLTNAYLPTPDYDYAKSQYDELDLIAMRSKMLTEALKLVGVYDKTADGVQRMLNQAVMNQLIPVDNWAMFAEKGGIKGQVDWMPLAQVVEALNYLSVRKATLSQEVFELLGVSDIQRGMASTKETATTQRLKAQFGSARSSMGSEEIARFVTDNYRMRAEIICKHWQPQTILRVSQIDKTPDAAIAQAAVQLMKTDPSIAMRVKISANNITAPDWELEKAQRVDFLQSISGFITVAQPMVEKFPSTASFLIETIQWVASGFKAGKQIEGVLDQALQGIKADMAKPKPPPEPTAQDKKDMAAAQKSHADAQKQLVDAALQLVQMGFDPMTALMMATQLPPKFDPATPPQQSAPPGAGAPTGAAAAAPASGPPAPGMGGPGGVPPRPPMPMPALPGVPGMQ